MEPVTAEQLHDAILKAGCLHNARYHKDCLTVANWVNSEFNPAPPVKMTPQAVATLMGWPLKLGMVHVVDPEEIARINSRFK